MSLTKRLTKGVNYPKTRSVGRRPSNKAGQMFLKSMSLTEQLTKGVNYKTKQIGRPKAVKQSRSAGSNSAPVHEAASTRRVCLTTFLTMSRIKCVQNHDPRSWLKIFVRHGGSQRQSLLITYLKTKQVTTAFCL